MALQAAAPLSLVSGFFGSKNPWHRTNFPSSSSSSSDSCYRRGGRFIRTAAAAAAAAATANSPFSSSPSPQRRRFRGNMRVHSSNNGSIETTYSPQIVCFGEMLIDFVPTISGLSLAEAPAFKKAPGGAPANVAVGVARLGGSAAFIGKDFHGRVSGLKVNQVDTTGAGDAFVAGILSQLAGDISLLQDEGRLRDALKFANACGALTVMERGAIPALPTRQAVLDALVNVVAN